ncbi:protein prenyltransferase alpha subunit repeat [Cryptosporidium andersoni]|uniref:Geranylgeranyl transferase type-2 subunit alpha n=1 Tax=Cryptosporidium andersoni TaxID=117008 RepID=A0A1J4MTG8_9CRYT|nr:protein prenyltransferase alpha subunit repeat [Cryptosporidium andersoni]
MHGRTKSNKLILTEEKKILINQAKCLLEKCIKNINSTTEPTELMDLTLRIFKTNVEISSLWNFRKWYISNIYNSNFKEGFDTILCELKLTEDLLFGNPKSYSLWYHRVWIIVYLISPEKSKYCNIPQGIKYNNNNFVNYWRNIYNKTEDINYNSNNNDDKISNNYKYLDSVETIHKDSEDIYNINKNKNIESKDLSKEDNYSKSHILSIIKIFKDELNLCERFLQFDDRNFHCWNHRLFLLTCLTRICYLYPMIYNSYPEFRDIGKSEIALTKQYIEDNFSNYSSWYQRILLNNTPNVSIIENIEDLKLELDLIHQAIFTEPNDQSIWQYYQWLIGDKFPKIMLNKVNYINCRFYILKATFISGNKSKFEFEFSQACAIDTEKSYIYFEDNEIYKIKGSWIIVNNEMKLKPLINNRLPREYLNNLQLISKNWLYIIDEEFQNFNKFEAKLRQNIYVNIVISQRSGQIYSNKIDWIYPNSLNQHFGLRDIQIENKLETKLDINEIASFILYNIQDNNKSNLNILEYKSKLNLKDIPEKLINEWVDTLIQECDLLTEIVELEPNCKYPILTRNFIYFILQVILPNNKINKNIDIYIDEYRYLQKIDELRSGYYRNLSRNIENILK